MKLKLVGPGFSLMSPEKKKKRKEKRIAKPHGIKTISNKTRSLLMNCQKRY